jgi:ABC-type transporter Mla subunit MlaD
MRLATNYDLRIPNDATAYLSRSGILGETYVDIDVSGASGPPAHSGDVLKTRASGPDAQQLLKHLVEALRKMPCAAKALQSIQDDTTAKVKTKK